jgi:hypothetical protein
LAYYIFEGRHGDIHISCAAAQKLIHAFFVATADTESGNSMITANAKPDQSDDGHGHCVASDFSSFKHNLLALRN